MNVIICGMPMCGKTTIGQMLARNMQRSFIDTDWLIEQSYNAHTGKNYTCREIFANEGHEFFRLSESQQVEKLRGVSNAVIALGGGTLTNPDNANTITLLGPLVYLKTPIDTLWKRVVSKGIPPYLDANDPRSSYNYLADIREPYYEKVAKITIDTENLSPKEIVNEILYFFIEEPKRL